MTEDLDDLEAIDVVYIFGDGTVDEITVKGLIDQPASLYLLADHCRPVDRWRERCDKQNPVHFISSQETAYCITTKS